MNETNEIYYVVQVLRHWDSLMVLGYDLSAEPTTPGCIGFMPVFKNLEAAEAWRQEHHPEASIAGIVQVPPHVPPQKTRLKERE